MRLAYPASSKQRCLDNAFYSSASAGEQGRGGDLDFKPQLVGKGKQRQGPHAPHGVQTHSALQIILPLQSVTQQRWLPGDIEPEAASSNPLNFDACQAGDATDIHRIATHGKGSHLVAVRLRDFELNCASTPESRARRLRLRERSWLSAMPKIRPHLRIGGPAGAPPQAQGANNDPPNRLRDRANEPTYRN